ncbi:phosphatase PAP2 family protein [Streptomyces phaeoluteigriseus]|uniref:Phosphatase PAP2 family protein n=1 Tax=Streptomyces phaeoluteigriseus TaxID=114686 RepID=A0ABY4Z8L1_9ACTN|nr:phosphatase PAP2 family protein [Streptomyces phaeoluteigriseus]USQ85372.1 phosphatase PAP2 family protein [Streptomyces phaeoluteigriseus]
MPLRFTTRRSRERRRREADHRFGVRLLGAAVVAALAAVAFGLLVVLVEGRWQPLRRLDASAARRLNETALDHPAWTGTLRLLSDWVWDPVTLRVVVALLTLWLLRRGAWRLAAWSAVTAVAGGLIGVLVKVVVERARPTLEDPVAHAPGFSFPSGHAMTATTSFAILLLVLLPMVPRAWRAGCWCFAVLSVLGVGFTRVALGVHWFSDVVGGWLLGLVVVALTAGAFEAWRADIGRRTTELADGLEPELSGPHPEPSMSSPPTRGRTAPGPGGHRAGGPASGAKVFRRHR